MGHGHHLQGGADSRTKRLLDMVVLLLDAKRPIPFSELREHFADYRTVKPEAGLRAFERDKATLLELGVPIRWIGGDESNDLPPEGGYIIDRQKYRLPEVTLTPDEVAALVVTAAAARHQPEFPYRHTAEMAVRKLMFDLAGLSTRGRRLRGPDGGSQRDAALPVDVMVHMPSAYRSRSLAEHLATLEEAVRFRKRVTIKYDHHRAADTPPRESPVSTSESAQAARDGVPQPLPLSISEKHHAGHDGPQQSVREVDPYGLVYRQGAWLLVGHCHTAQAVRRFRVDRILELRIAPRPRTPDFEVPEDFSLKEHGSFSPWRFEREPKVKVVLWVSAEIPWVAEEDFGPAQRTARVDRDHEGTSVEFACGNTDYLVSRVLGAAGALRVLSPESLRRRIAEAASAVARRNNGLERA